MESGVTPSNNQRNKTTHFLCKIEINLILHVLMLITRDTTSLLYLSTKMQYLYFSITTCNTEVQNLLNTLVLPLKCGV